MRSSNLPEFPDSAPPPTNPWTPFNTFGDDPNFKDDYSQQWNLEVQRQMTGNLMLSAAYVGSRNGRLAYTGLANAARRASPNNTCAPNDAACRAAYFSAVDALRPMPWVNANITYSQSIGYSNYHALQLRAQRRFTNGLHSLLAYTWENPRMSAAAISTWRMARGEARRFKIIMIRPRPAASLGTTSHIFFPGLPSMSFQRGEASDGSQADRLRGSWATGS